MVGWGVSGLLCVVYFLGPAWRESVGDVFFSLSPVAFMTIWHGGVQEFFSLQLFLWKFIFYCSVNGRKTPWIRCFVLFISEYCP